MTDLGVDVAEVRDIIDCFSSALHAAESSSMSEELVDELGPAISHIEKWFAAREEDLLAEPADQIYAVKRLGLVYLAVRSHFEEQKLDLEKTSRSIVRTYQRLADGKQISQLKRKELIKFLKSVEHTLRRLIVSDKKLERELKQLIQETVIPTQIAGGSGEEGDHPEIYKVEGELEVGLNELKLVLYIDQVQGYRRYTLFGPPPLRSVILAESHDEDGHPFGSSELASELLSLTIELDEIEEGYVSDGSLLFSLFPGFDWYRNEVEPALLAIIQLVVGQSGFECVFVWQSKGLEPPDDWQPV